MTGTEIVNWQDQMAAEAKEVAAQETPQMSYISLKSGIMSYMKQPVPGNKMRCIIIGTAFERRYDTKPYDPMNFVPPDCYALSVTSDEGMVPPDTVKDQQSTDCDSCPMSKWQPNPQKPGKKHKPCKEKRRMLLVPALSDDYAKAEAAMLNVPTTSVKNWANYVNECAAVHRRPPWGVITEISVHPHLQFQIEVKFTCVGLVEEDKLAGVHARTGPAAHAMLMVEHEPYGEHADTKPAAPEPVKPGKAKKY